MGILFKNLNKYPNTTAFANTQKNNKIYSNSRKFMIMLQLSVKNLLKYLIVLKITKKI
jgi:hypothetical protein